MTVSSEMGLWFALKRNHLRSSRAAARTEFELANEKTWVWFFGTNKPMLFVVKV